MHRGHRQPFRNLQNQKIKEFLSLPGFQSERAASVPQAWPVRFLSWRQALGRGTVKGCSVLGPGSESQQVPVLIPKGQPVGAVPSFWERGR